MAIPSYIVKILTYITQNLLSEQASLREPFNEVANGESIHLSQKSLETDNSSDFTLSPIQIAVTNQQWVVISETQHSNFVAEARNNLIRNIITYV